IIHSLYFKKDGKPKALRREGQTLLQNCIERPRSKTQTESSLGRIVVGETVRAVIARIRVGKTVTQQGVRRFGDSSCATHHCVGYADEPRVDCNRGRSLLHQLSKRKIVAA